MSDHPNLSHPLTGPRYRDNIEIDIKKAVDAYDTFKHDELQKRNEKRSSDGHIIFKFERAIRNQIRILDKASPAEGTMLATKQTLSNWRHSAPKRDTYRPFCVIVAVAIVSGVDISKRSILTGSAINISNMAELGSVNAKKVSNDPDQIEDAQYFIEMSSVLFKSFTARLMSDGAIDCDGTICDGATSQIGTVTIGINEASIHFSSDAIEISNILKRLSPESDVFFGVSNGCVLIWSDAKQCWIIQPLEGTPMRVHMERVRLCSAVGRRGEIAKVFVQAEKSGVDYDFKVKSGYFRNERQQANHLEAARERIFSIFLSQERGDSALLSLHQIKLP